MGFFRSGDQASPLGRQKAPLRKRFLKTIFRTIPPLTLYFLTGCFSKTVVIDNQHHTFSSKEIGFFLSLQPGWRLSDADNTLFVADLQPNGTRLARLTATEEKNIPSLEDYLTLASFLTLPQKTQKMAQGELARLQPLSSRKFEFKGNVWEESVWLGERKGAPRIFHTLSIPVGLSLVQLHFEFPTFFYENHPQTIASVLEGIRIDPPKPSLEKAVRAYQSIGELYTGRRLWKEAIDAFSVALEKRPHSTQLHILLGQSYFQNGEADLALKEFLKATELDPQNSRAYEGIADAYFKKGLIDQGITAVKRAVGLSPDNISLYVKLGEAYLKEERPQESIKNYQKLIQRNPESAAGHFGLGKAYLSIDLYEQAIIELEQAIKLQPRQVEAHCLLEKAYSQLQSTAEAEREGKLCPHTDPPKTSG